MHRPRPTLHAAHRDRPVPGTKKRETRRRASSRAPLLLGFTVAGVGVFVMSSLAWSLCDATATGNLKTGFWRGVCVCALAFIHTSFWAYRLLDLIDLIAIWAVDAPSRPIPYPVAPQRPQ